MDTTGYVSLSHQMALRRHLDIIANNIANASTNAYRRESVMFQDFMSNMPQAEVQSARPVSFVLDFGVTRDPRPGDMIPTDNPLDVAIKGPGYFTVLAKDGRPAYTRNGAFRPSEDGYLTLLSGERVLDTQNQPITVGPNEAFFKVADDGTVSSNQGIKGQLLITNLPESQNLERLGDSLWRGPNATAIPTQQVKLKSGMLEGSNVQPVMEMSEMIDVLRTYQSTTRLMDRYDDIRKGGIERLGRVQ